jgi:hypothetical protein
MTAALPVRMHVRTSPLPTSKLALGLEHGAGAGASAVVTPSHALAFLCHLCHLCHLCAGLRLADHLL